MSDFKERYLSAVRIAAEAHFGQKRKGTVFPYLVHPVSVAAIAEEYGLEEDIVLALVVHDVLEDGGDHKRYAAKIKLQLGDNVLRITEGLSDPDFPEGMKRKEKKKIINERLSKLPFDVQMAKLCDIMHNTHDVIDAKPKFAEKYLDEKLDQMKCFSQEVKQTKLFQDVFSQVRRNKKRTSSPSLGS